LGCIWGEKSQRQRKTILPPNNQNKMKKVLIEIKITDEETGELIAQRSTNNFEIAEMNLNSLKKFVKKMDENIKNLK